LKRQSAQIKTNQVRGVLCLVTLEIQGTQVPADDTEGLIEEMGVKAPPAAGKIQHQTIGRQPQQSGQGRALLVSFSILVRVDLKIGWVVKIPSEPIHG
jgi:hypothetical protein